VNDLSYSGAGRGKRTYQKLEKFKKRGEVEGEGRTQPQFRGWLGWILV